jgi:hypothetical protein
MMCLDKKALIEITILFSNNQFLYHGAVLLQVGQAKQVYPLIQKTKINLIAVNIVVNSLSHQVEHFNPELLLFFI